MSARSSRFSGFGSRRRRGKAAGAVIACAVMLLAGCGGSVTGGGATDAPSVIVRGDTLGRNWASVVPTVEPSAGQVVVKWDKQITEDATESVIGYEVQISSGSAGPWIGAATGCKKSETKSSTRQTCTATGLADGTYYFNVAAVRKNVLTKKTRTTDFSAVSLPAIVLSPPGTPAKPTGVAGDSKVTVTVAAGTATDGTLGGAPTSYTVTASPAVSGGTCTVTGASGSCPVTGLTNGTAYTFTATATNTAPGTSAASVASASVTPATGPGQPGIGAVSSTGPPTATVTFTAPSSDGGSPITRYTATSSPAGGTGTVYQVGSGQITVSGLTLGTSYKFTVTATNAAGTSAPSVESASFTSTYAVGSTGPGGGKVFYVSTAGFTSTGSACGTSCHYLEAQTATAPAVTWCTTQNRLVEGTFGTAIGTGFSNTQLMSNSTYCSEGAGASARAASGGGYSDWFLPSKDELAELKAKSYLVNNWNHAWSSTQIDARTAWISGANSGIAKETVLLVRPVRAF